ncbi:DUF7059 domain-containing protein [Helcobacillus massiliensis]|uniref:Methylase of polypeptide subunit release factors n=1 Tax=Helcobacillus massiliensis TaxID=521392 RepID=A0A839QT18_9MICO|nr:methyltransferase [Helcobacillus massiliensis]MBB3023202.1 methylase of polypeptide subunit release factors [Helcobacillus massiliensis]
MAAEPLSIGPLLGHLTHSASPFRISGEAGADGVLPPIDALRADLAAADFTVTRINEVLSPMAQRALEAENAIPAQRELAVSEHPSALLMRLLALGAALPADEVEEVLPTLTVAGALALGLLTPAGDPAGGALGRDADGRPRLVRAAIDLRPYEAEDDDGAILWWIASDLGETATGRALDGDHVLGIGGATSTLIALTPRSEVRSALDLGCGCGIQALHAARHARSVIATDISERALAFTAFNALLNRESLPDGCALELRQGSMLEPVAGERFDLVVSNPPFVITPRTPGGDTWTYRDGGRAGDALVADLIRDLPNHLEPGGIAAMLANWEITAGADWREHPSAWLDGSDVDAFVIQRDREDPASYAQTWLRDGGLTPRDDRWAAMMTAYLEDFASRDVEEVGFGYVILHRPTDTRPAVRLLDEVGTTGQGPLGPRLKGMLVNAVTLAGLNDDDLLASHLARADDVMERRHFVPGAEDPVMIDLVQGGAFGRTLPLTSEMAGVLGVLDGTHPLKPLVQAYAALSGEELEEVSERVLEQVRTLLHWGFLSFRAE